MKRGLVLSKQKRIQLCTNITEHEIYISLQSIGNDKAPGIDSYNALSLSILGRSLKRMLLRLSKASSQQESCLSPSTALLYL